jgi:multidrug efflux pump subunit AcrA (membrane-fusion protein)
VTVATVAAVSSGRTVSSTPSSRIRETSASAMLSDKGEKINFAVGDHVAKDQVVMTFPTDNPATQYYQ